MLVLQPRSCLLHVLVRLDLVRIVYLLFRSNLLGLFCQGVGYHAFVLADAES